MVTIKFLYDNKQLALEIDTDRVEIRELSNMWEYRTKDVRYGTLYSVKGHMDSDEKPSFDEISIAKVEKSDDKTTSNTVWYDKILYSYKDDGTMHFIENKKYFEILDFFEGTDFFIQKTLKGYEDMKEWQVFSELYDVFADTADKKTRDNVYEKYHTLPNIVKIATKTARKLIRAAYMVKYDF